VSGTLGGVGGIGGLLARTDNNGSSYYHTDGNGNVTMLVDGSGNVLAKYLYDSFGNTLGMWGPLATANTYRFSSKEIEARTGDYDYGYRYYAPNLQRWLNQDPIGERGGINLYTYVHNNPINLFDPWGFDAFDDMGLSDARLNLAANKSGMAADLALYPGDSGNSSGANNPNGSSSSPCPGSGNKSPLYGGTFQVGLSLSGYLGPVHANWNVGLAIDMQGHGGIYDTITPPFTGYGGGESVSGSLAFAVSNGGSINDLAGPFGYGTGSLGAGLNGSLDGFSGQGSQRQTIVGGGFSAGLGEGGGAAAGINQTYIHPLW
jgi:RHS repeat-associated protein